ncbi:MAG: hypothetical protein WCK00_17025 [Deltaproteobacteria bacterium]
MSWQSTNLAASMGGLASKANLAVSQVQGKLNKINSQVAAVNNTLNAAIGGIAALKGDMEKLTESGFYMITLSPEKGSWAARLAAATNAPPAHGYCCGVATIIIAPDLSTVAASFKKMVDAVKKPMADAANIVDQFDFSDFEEEEDPEDIAPIAEVTAKDWGDIFESGKWTASNLADVFGGLAEGTSKAANLACTKAKSLQAGINQAGKSVSAINKGLAATRKILTEMGTTGVYNIILPPGSGGAVSRLQNEAGAPPKNVNYYSAGYACVTQMPDLQGLAGKFDTLSGIVGI